MTAERLQSLFETAGVDGYLHAVEVRSGREVGYEPDTPVVAASTFKLPVLVGLFRQADAGQIDLTEQVAVPVEGRAPGPTGLSVLLDPVRVSWRDLAQLMMAVSDNAATDVICERIGLDSVNRTMRELGLTDTVIEDDCRGIFRTLAEDAGVASLTDVPMVPPPGLLTELRALKPATTDRTTPRDMTRLLRLIYTDAAASRESCEQMRRILLNQVWPHRLAAGFPEDDVFTAGKTGTLFVWRNEVGAVGYPDGSLFAVAVYTRARQPRIKDPRADAVIGAAARAAVDALRGAASGPVG